MPFLGAGVDQTVNPTTIPQWVFTPTANAPSSVRFFNSGNSVVYVGQANVNQFSGIPIYPGNRPVEFQNMLTSLYACSGVVAGTVSSTTSTALTAGTTSFTVGTTAGFAVGTSLLIGNTGKGQEVGTVAGTTATAVTLSTALLYDHSTASTVSTATPTIGQLRVTAGVV